MAYAQHSGTRLISALVAGAVAGSFCMAIVGFIPNELTMQGLLDAFLWALWFLVFTVPIAVLVGVPAFSILRKRDLLNPASVCTTGLLAGFATIAAMYGVSGQSIPLGFLMLRGVRGFGWPRPTRPAVTSGPAPTARRPTPPLRPRAG